MCLCVSPGVCACLWVSLCVCVQRNISADARISMIICMWMDSFSFSVYVSYIRACPKVGDNQRTWPVRLAIGSLGTWSFLCQSDKPSTHLA